jgi:hypothetical protein
MYDLYTRIIELAKPAPVLNYILVRWSERVGGTATNRELSDSKKNLVIWPQTGVLTPKQTQLKKVEEGTTLQITAEFLY